MSMIYDNWERLMAAVLKREEFWEMCHAPPSPTISSKSSDFDSNSSFHLDEDFKSAKFDIVQEPAASQTDQHEWIEQYEPGVYLTLVSSTDGTKQIKRISFSRTRFRGGGAETWWHDNQEKVYKKYDITVGLGRRLRKSLNLSQAGLASKVPFLGKSEESSGSSEEPDELISLVENQFQLWLTASDIVDPWAINYEPGVYAIIEDFGETSRICFSRRRFHKHQAEAWWLQKQNKVYNTALAIAMIGGRPSSKH